MIHDKISIIMTRHQLAVLSNIVASAAPDVNPDEIALMEMLEDAVASGSYEMFDFTN